MKTIWNITVLEQPSLLLRLQHSESTHVSESTYSITRTSMNATKIYFALTHFFVKVDSPLHTKGLIHRFVNSCVNFRVEKRPSMLLIPQYSWTV